MAIGDELRTWQRGFQTALIGLIFQGFLLVATGLLSVYAGNLGLNLLVWYVAVGLPAWLILMLIYSQHKAEKQTALEAQQLSSRKAEGSAFDLQMDELESARKRVESIQKYGLGIISLVMAFALAALGGIWLRWAMQRYAEEARDGFSRQLFEQTFRSTGPFGAVNPNVIWIALALLAFVTFIFARYVAGMTRVSHWSMLRAGASYLMGHAVVMALFAITVFWLQFFENSQPLGYMSIVLPIILLVLALETLLNYVLGFYRPRKKDELPRPAFDSRLFSVLTNPQSLGAIIGEAINYQFGVEITRSWFLRLLAKAIAPLVVLGVLSIMLMTSVVIIRPHQGAVILRFGEIQGEPVSSGLHFKLPWPIETIRVYDMHRIREIPDVGSIEVKKNENGQPFPILWTNEHSEGQETFLISIPTLSPESQAEGNTTGGIALVAAEVVVHYRIDPDHLVEYASSADAPEAVLKVVAEEITSRYFASRHVDELLSDGVSSGSRYLQKEIQDRVDELGLGLLVVRAAILNVHPPREAEVADSFHKSINALSKSQTLIEQASKYKTDVLSRIVGSETRAQDVLQRLIDIENLKRELRQTDETSAEAKALQARIVKQTADAERLLLNSDGSASAALYAARADRLTYILSEEAALNRARAMAQAYGYAPELMRWRLFYQAFLRGTEKSRVLILPPYADQATVRIDMTGDLDLQELHQWRREQAQPIQGMPNSPDWSRFLPE